MRHGLTVPWPSPTDGCDISTPHGLPSRSSRDTRASLDGAKGQFRGPGFWNYNTSRFRTFPLQGRVRLQLRAEAFSVTNTPQWSNPNGSVTSGNFMKVLGTRGGARYIRFGLRLEF